MNGTVDVEADEEGNDEEMTDEGRVLLRQFVDQVGIERRKVFDIEVMHEFGPKANLRR